jgi:transcriptional regulator with XRE-family HTH domain
MMVKDETKTSPHMSRNFSPHQNFADNLRALCARHGSIAAVCSGIGMNRQQFNKYLAGSTLPNAPALERICGFFKVVPESLFRAPQGPAGAAMPEAAAGALLRMRDSTLRPGCYHFYTPWPREPLTCVRSALFVYRKDGMTLFSRFTKFRQPGLRQRYFLSGRHDGVVLESGTARYLLATNRKGLSETSLVSIGAESALSPDFMSGLALVMDPSGHPISVRATLQYRGSTALLRRTISEACVLPLSDSSIPDEVRQSVSADPLCGEASLVPFSLLDSLPQHLRRGGSV